MPEHIQHLTIILQLFDAHRFFVKESKCIFATNTVAYLGHLIQASTVSLNPEKVQAILLWPSPTSFTTLRAFLGITGFYRRFIRGYTTLASPLTYLLKLTKFT